MEEEENVFSGPGKRILIGQQDEEDGADDNGGDGVSTPCLKSQTMEINGDENELQTKEFSMSGADKSRQVISLLKDDRSHLSLPLFFNGTELCALGSRVGMECLPLRTPPGPYHYHVADQTKSLQELQNEVGALLEFRDLVIETFPDLKNKMASSTACSTITGMPNSSLASRRTEWEPGIRVRRKLMQKESEISPSSLIRSRSNSHSGKKEPKSGESVVIQDSGFSTETSSSKETHSASSSTGGQGATASSSHGMIVNSRLTGGPSNHLLVDHENELWNLLDVIHRKSTRLRDEVEQFQTRQNSLAGSSSNSNSSSTNNQMQIHFQKQLTRLSKDDVQILRKERDRLMDKLSEMEAETLSGRIKITGMQDEIAGLCLAKKELEEKLRTVLSQSMELNYGIRDLHMQHVQKGDKQSRIVAPSARRIAQSTDSTIKSSPLPNTAMLNGSRLLPSGFAPFNTRPSDDDVDISNLRDIGGDNKANLNVNSDYLVKKNNCDLNVTKSVKNEVNVSLGRLDGLVSCPNRLNKVRLIDSKKVASILLETNFVELQRHLLTLTVQNQVLQQKLDQATRSKIQLIKRLEKAREDIDDLKFQLEEKNIEFEGTRAQLRVLESRSKSDYSSQHHSNHNHASASSISSGNEDDGRNYKMQGQISTPSMKAMIPLTMNDDLNLQHSSSTESAHDQTEHQQQQQHQKQQPMEVSTPKKRIPSRIPLPGTLMKAPSKPPSGRKIVNSGPPSNRSLNNSNLKINSASNNSLNKRDMPSLTRPESAQSWRNSYPNQTTTATPTINQQPIQSPLRGSISSIPISTSMSNSIGSNSTKGSPGKNSSKGSPTRQKPEGTFRARNLMDSLTNQSQMKSPNNSMSSKLSSSSTPITMVLNKTSPTAPVPLARNKMSAVPVRRVSSGSVGRGSSDREQEGNENGKRSAQTKGIDEIKEVGEENSLKELIPPRRDFVNQRFGKDTIEFWRESNTSEEAGRRDLIKEYFARTVREPPPIFEMAQNKRNFAVNNYMFVDSRDDTVIETFTAVEALNEIEMSSVITAEKKARQAFEEQPKVQESQPNCHLIGKVTPNILKTWEQLNSTVNHEETANSKEDLLVETLFFRKTFEDVPKFQVNYVQHSKSVDDLFYDSIDEEDIVSNPNSIIYREKGFDEVDDLNLMVGGEGMAEFDSLDRKQFRYWSLETEDKL